MTRRILVATLAVVAGALGPQSVHRTVSAQAPAPDRMAIVASDERLHLQAWHASGGGYEKVWEATPRVVDPATWDTRRQEGIAPAYDGGMTIADLDGDGSNELVIADAFGLTVYGRSPAYYSFPTAENSAPAVTVADVDGDGAAELVTQWIAAPGSEGDEREIEVFKVAAGGLTSIWKQRLPGWASAIVVGDVDNDGEKEIISGGGDTVAILKRRPGSRWEVTAELPTTPTVGLIATNRWVRVADVDSDGKNEIIIGGCNGKVTILKSQKVGGRVTYPVLWQSANLMADGMKAMPNERRSPSCLITSVEVADLDGDKQAEIVVSTQEFGRIGEKDIRAGRLHVFKFDGRGDFARVWVSDWISPSAYIAGAADVNGDGANEIVVNGRSVYKRDGAADSFRAVASLLPTATSAIVGALPDLREPSAVRIVPLYWTLPNREVAEGETFDVTVTLRSVWSEARDVTLTVIPQDPAVQVSDATFKFPSIPANGTVTTPIFKLTGRQSGKFVHMRFDLTAANGYRQSSVAGSVFVSSPTPMYMADVEPRLASALVRARDDNKRVLIQWGSNADPAATSLIATMRKDATVSNTVVYEYELVRADMKDAERVAAKYRGTGSKLVPPYFTVLDAQGKVLASQSAAAFKGTGEGAPLYDTKKLNELLAKYKPTYVRGEPLLTEALSQAKKDQKTLFLWFSAPT